MHSTRNYNGVLLGILESVYGGFGGANPLKIMGDGSDGRSHYSPSTVSIGDEQRYKKGTKRMLRNRTFFDANFGTLKVVYCDRVALSLRSG